MLSILKNDPTSCIPNYKSHIVFKRLNIFHFKKTKLFIIRLNNKPHKWLLPCFLSYLMKSNAQLAYEDVIQNEKTWTLSKISFHALWKIHHVSKMMSIDSYQSYKGHAIHTLWKTIFMNKLSKNSLFSNSSMNRNTM